MKIVALSFAVLLSMPSFANPNKDNDLSADSVEFANILSHCLTEYKDALDKERYVSRITKLVHKESKPGIRIDSYVLTISKGGHVFGPPQEVAATLHAVRTIDGSGRVSGDKSVSYECKVKVR